MTYEAFHVVVVPFPFTDKQTAKRRPALVLSASRFNTPAGHSVLAMITSRKNALWPLDVAINNLQAAGLSTPSVVRMKLFTLDHRLIIRTAGYLSDNDRAAVITNLGKLLDCR
ncbi:MAG: type II toxin-antitoxin system PemK/MazF family toxin [Gammaproteobacteria bacterium]|nr:type II toxin-antitoxin system PemK/MazF family toxin [Gammaproteobacteria bacterium]